MAHAGFVHLRVHSAYSLLEGAIKIPALVAACRAQGMPAVAITDTNNLFGALEFSAACAAGGVQPIVGCQLSLARARGNDMVGAPRGSRALDADPIVLLVQNEGGYANLLKLLSAAYLEAEDASRPQVEIDRLAAHADGLIALTGGASGPVGRLLQSGQTDAAETCLGRLAAAFPGRLYVELSRRGLPEEGVVEPSALDLAYRLGLPLVATNGAYFLEAEDFEAHDVLMCVAQGTYVANDDRRRLTPDHRLRSAEEMRALFADLPEAVDNTLVVARRCAFMVEGRKPILPPFKTDTGRGEADELRHQAREGLERRLAAHVVPADATSEERERLARPYRERLDYELGVIIDMGFAGYFLIVAEFIGWAKATGIPVGPGRGSGAGSVAAWALAITDLDPLRWGLLFERFLNPERVSMPDFDVDFCQERRDEVLHHVQERYGRDRVAQIITFGKLQARAVLKDVGRVLQMPYSQVDRISKLVPHNPTNPFTLDQAIDSEPLLQRMIETDESVERLVAIARKLEGLYRHASTHAAGVVIGDRPLDELIPLYRDPRSNMPVTGFNMKWVEAAGLVKFDFLGLKTLTVLSRAVALLAERGMALDLDRLPLDDPTTYAMIGRGDTTGVFQLESSGMRDVLRKLRPDSFEDIIAVVALYRPGPMDNIPSYIKRKHGEEKPDYLYPTLEGILRETYGIMIYQEQVMQIAQELAGFSLGKADLLRRAMGKKIKSEMDEQRQAFVDGATGRGVPPAKAEQIFDLVAKFAGYGFNKSHAAAYALVAYQTAYLKANHPVEFFAASMTLDINNTDKLNGFRQELVRLGIPLLPPDINSSPVYFGVDAAPDGRPGIRYALAAIKKVGVGAMQALIAERHRGGRFAGLADFARRLDSHALNKMQIENLVRAGAFDCLNGNRRQTFEAIEKILKIAAAESHDRQSNQMGLFGDQAGQELSLHPVPDWSPMERLKLEFEAVGFYLSAHPLDTFGRSLERLKVRSIAEVLAEGRSGPVNLAGTVIAARETNSAKGSRLAFVQFSDSTGAFEVTVFSEVLAQCREILEAGTSLFIKAAAQFDGESVRFTAMALEPLEKVAARAAIGLRLVVDSAAPLPPLRDILKRAAPLGDGGRRGRITLVSRLQDTTEVDIDLPGRYAVSPAVLRAVRDLPGILDVQEI